MTSFFQSKVWHNIQSKVYNRETINIKIFDKKYWGLVKQKDIGPFKLKWIQILGVEIPKDDNLVKENLTKLKNSIKRDKSVFFIQLGLVNEIIHFANKERKTAEMVDDIKKMRLDTENYLKEKFGLQLTLRENMPPSNIIYHLCEGLENLKDMSSMAQRYIKKAQKLKLSFDILGEDEYNIFYEKWLYVSMLKGFRIISYETYIDLLNFLNSTNQGKIFVVRQNNEIIAGSIFVFNETDLVYLYGFADREYSKTGAHYRLNYNIMQRGYANGFKRIDMMGGAPTGFENHSLQGVSRFKEALGGEKIEYYGSYDIVLTSLFYNLFKVFRKINKR